MARMTLNHLRNWLKRERIATRKAARSAWSSPIIEGLTYRETALTDVLSVLGPERRKQRRKAR